jgi:hypothetical protein
MDRYIDSYGPELGEYLIAKTIERALEYLRVNPGDDAVIKAMEDAIKIRDGAWTRARSMGMGR